MSDDQRAPHHHVAVEVEHFDRAIGMIADRMDALQGEFHSHRTELPREMATAFQLAITDPVALGKLITTVVDISQRRAAEKTGNAVGSALRSLFTRWLVIACVLMIVAKTAGIDVASKVWAALKP